MAEGYLSRRGFFALIPVALFAHSAGAALALGAFRALFDSDEHPTPRPGITAARVLTAKRLHNKDAAPVFDMVRKIPQVVDGIHCYCGCADLKGFYSLLSCYEKDGMAQHCEICRGEARLVYKLHADGWSLNGIRASINAAFADSK